MSAEELAAYCYSKITKLSKDVLYNMMAGSNTSITLNDKWTPASEHVREDGFYYFSISESLYYNLTGYVHNGETSGENQETPDAPLFNTTGSENENETGLGEGQTNDNELGTTAGESLDSETGDRASYVV